MRYEFPARYKLNATADITRVPLLRIELTVSKCSRDALRI
jgi:hypothetical protein